MSFKPKGIPICLQTCSSQAVSFFPSLYLHTVLRTREVSLGKEVLDKVCVSREEQVMQLVYTHANRCVDVQPPTQVRAERLHFT